MDKQFINSIIAAKNELDNLRFEYPKLCERKLTQVRDSIIRQWYEDYDERKYYRPKGSLYDVVQIKIDGTDWDVEFDADAINDYYHHQSADYIYENSFVNGYHGGSIGTDPRTHVAVDVPYYRKPLKYYRYWSRPAQSGFSIQQALTEELQGATNDYLENEFDAALSRIESIVEGMS